MFTGQNKMKWHLHTKLYFCGVELYDPIFSYPKISFLCIKNVKFLIK